MNIITNIFIDLDSTLIYVEYDKEDAEKWCAEEKIPLPKSFNFIGDYNIYYPFLRSGAHKLLLELRKIGNVYMLTKASKDYAIYINKLFDFQFPENQIFHKKDIKKLPYKLRDREERNKFIVKEGHNFLIDDLPKLDNSDKLDVVEFFGSIKYIQIDKYDFHNRRPIDVEDIMYHVKSYLNIN